MEKGLRCFWNCIEYAAHQRNAWNEALNDWVELRADEALRRSLRDYEEQLVWIFTDWSIEIIFIDLMVEITRSLFEKYLSENWWAKIGTL